MQPHGAAHAEFVICDCTIERTLGWLNRSRRLSKNYERLSTSSEAMVYLAMLPLMTKRLAKQQTRYA